MRLLSILGCLLWATLASAQIVPDGTGGTIGGTKAATIYLGPGNVVASATVWVGARGYSTAYAAPGTNKAFNLRRASDNATCDFVIASNGNLGGTAGACAQGAGLSLAAFATQDATATCTIATTTATCTGASSTPHVGSTITGAGAAQPCYASAIGTFTGGAGTVTLAGNGTTSPCGTVGSGVTLTFTYGLFIPDAYDQSGGTNNLPQATAGNQMQLLPNCISGLPCMVSKASAQVLANAATTSTTNGTVSGVGMRTGNTGNVGILFNTTGSTPLQTGWRNATNTALLFAGTITTATASDNVFHAMQLVANGASSAIVIDATATTGVGAGTISTPNTGMTIGGPANFISEVGFWNVTTFNSTQYNNMCHNQFVYWGTPTSC